METAKIADLKNNLSRYLAEVRRGGEITVFDRDTPIARIVPYGPRDRRARSGARGRDDYWTPERLDELERRGLVKRGDARRLEVVLGARRPIKLPKGSPSVVDLLVQTRRESTR